jgi:hypothetical protein
MEIETMLASVTHEWSQLEYTFEDAIAQHGVKWPAGGMLAGSCTSLLTPGAQ